MSIFDYKEITKQLKSNDTVTRNEGNTKVDTIDIDNTKVYLKREDKNPTGSWKDRGTAFKISKIKTQKTKNAVISSSGNAAISYLEYAKQVPGLVLDIIVSDTSIPDKKVQKITSLIDGTQHTLHKTKQAKKLRAQLIAQKEAISLSSATDDDVLKGYWSLGFELAELINSTIQTRVPLFIQVSSGATLVGTVQGLSMKLKTDEWMPQIIVMQTETVSPIVNSKNQKLKNVKQVSLADAITDRSCLRSPQIRKIIDQTLGDAYAITNDELLTARRLVDLDISHNSLLSIAGLRRYKQNNDVTNAICIASGA